ncbi:MAG TPA: cation-transporting P-type ATPase, partial [Clostridia bacterium]|nr:cation-transporting P-type ATPase [Clostridia bacterium]
MPHDVHIKTKEKLTREALKKPAELSSVVQQRLLECAHLPADDVLTKMNSRLTGLTEEEVEQSRKIYGDNVIVHGRKKTLLERLFAAFINPFTLILIALAVVSLLTDIAFTAPEDQSYA